MKRFFWLILVAGVSCGRKTTEISPVRGDIAEAVFASGSLEPHQKYNLTAQSDGYLTELKIDDGSIVITDQVLAMIDNVPNEVSAQSAAQIYSIAAVNADPSGPVLAQALKNLEMLAAKRQQDSLQAGRYDRLFEQESTSRVQMENAKLAFSSSRTAHLAAVEAYNGLTNQVAQQLAQQRAAYKIAAVSFEHNRLKAPFGGKVYRLLKKKGDFVRRGETIAVIGHPDSLYARLAVDENSISKVMTGQAVVVNLNSQKDTNYQARITKVLPSFDEPTHSFVCEAEFERLPRLLIAGTQLQANIITGKKSGALLIPRNYLSFNNTVRLSGAGERQVTVGLVSGEWVEILDGLDEKSVIVAEAAE